MSRLVQQATRGRCEIGVYDCGEVYPCDDLAPYYVEGSGYGPMGARCCGDHAYRAADDGAEVTGPNGHPVRIDEDGELVERAA